MPFSLQVSGSGDFFEATATLDNAAQPTSRHLSDSFLPPLLVLRDEWNVGNTQKKSSAHECYIQNQLASPASAYAAGVTEPSSIQFMHSRLRHICNHCSKPLPTRVAWTNFDPRARNGCVDHEQLNQVCLTRITNMGLSLTRTCANQLRPTSLIYPFR